MVIGREGAVTGVWANNNLVITHIELHRICDTIAAGDMLLLLVESVTWCCQREDAESKQRKTEQE